MHDVWQIVFALFVALAVWLDGQQVQRKIWPHQNSGLLIAASATTLTHTHTQTFVFFLLAAGGGRRNAGLESVGRNFFALLAHV